LLSARWTTPLLPSGTCGRNTRGGYRHISALRPMTQRMIHQHESQHCLGDRRRAYANARIVTTMRFHHHWLTVLVDGVTRGTDTGSQLDRNRSRAVVPGRNTAQYSTRMVAGKTFRRDFIAVLGSLLRDRSKTGTDLDALDRIDTHQCISDVRIQLVI